MTKQIDQLVEDSLRKEPDFKLSMNFKDRVVRQIRKKERASQRRLYFFLSLGVLAMLVTGFALVSYYGAATGLTQFNGMVPIAILVGVLVAGVQFLDKILVKERYLKQLV